MPLDKLVDRIISDARRGATGILDESRAKREEMLARADAEAETVYAHIVSRDRRVAVEKKNQRVTMAALEARKEVLTEKRAIIDEVFERAVRSVVELPDAEYIELMSGWLLSAGKAEGQLIMSPRDSERVAGKIIKAVNAEIERRGGEGRLTLSPVTRAIAGGFILSSEGIEINNSLEALIHARREELEAPVVEILFGEGANG